MTRRERIALIRRSPAADHVRLVAPVAGVALAAVMVFGVVRLIAYGFTTIGPLPTVLVAWIPAALVTGILIGLCIQRSKGPRT